jgi:hypothetical protein
MERAEAFDRHSQHTQAVSHFGANGRLRTIDGRTDWHCRSFHCVCHTGTVCWLNFRRIKGRTVRRTVEVAHQNFRDLEIQIGPQRIFNFLARSWIHHPSLELGTYERTSIK